MEKQPLRTKKLADQRAGMTLIVKTITRLTIGLILLYGIYIVLHGHLTPGGGFAGGVIVALSFIHIMLAFGRDLALKKVSRAAASLFESLGALLFLGIGVIGILFGYFFLNFWSKGEPFNLFSAGIIPFCNIAIAFKVGAGLFGIFLALVLIKMTGSTEGEREEGEEK